MSTIYNDIRANLNGIPEVETDASGAKVAKTDPKTGEVITGSEENITELKANEQIAACKTAKLPEPEIVKLQTFQYTKLTSVDELLPLIEQYNPDPEGAAKAALDIVNRGLVLAQQKAGREFMTDPDQGAVEGVYDLMTDASKPGEGRRKADPATKALRMLSEWLGHAVTQDELNSVMASLAAKS